MRRHRSCYLTATPCVSVASNGTALPHSPYITQQICCFRHPQKRCFSCHEAWRVSPGTSLTYTKSQKQATQIEDCGLVAKLHELAAWVEFIVDSETGLSSTFCLVVLSLSLSILPHQRIRRPRSGWPAVRSATLASYLGKVVSSLQSICIATWAPYCDTVAFRLLLIGSLLTVDFYGNVVTV
jgi:hypothetical protein